MRQNGARDRVLPVEEVTRYAALMAEHAGADQLYAEGVSVVPDVPGRTQHFTAAEAARLFEFSPAR